MANFKFDYSIFRKYLAILFCLFIFILAFNHCTKKVENLTVEDQKTLDNYTMAVKDGLFERKPDSLQKLALQVIAISNKVENKKTLIQAFNLCAATYEILGNPDSAIYYANKMERLADKIGDPINLARAHNILSMANLQKYNHELAKTHLKEAIQISLHKGGSKDIATYYLSLGVIFNESRTYDSSLYYYQLAAKIYETNNNLKGMAKCYGNIGGIHVVLKNFNEASNYYHKALNINKETQNYTSLAYNYSSLGIINTKFDKDDTALIYYDSAMALHESMGNISMIIQTKINMAIAYKKKGQHELALKLYFENLEFSEKKQFDRGIMLNKVGIGNTYLNMGAYQEAYRYLKEALQFANEKGIIEDIDKTLLSLTHSAIMLNNQDKAIESLNQYQLFIDSLNFQNQQKIASDLEAKYQLQEKNTEIRFMTKVNQSKTRLNYLLIIILALVSIFGFIVFILNRKLQSNYRSLYRKELHKNHTIYEVKQAKETKVDSKDTGHSEWEDMWKKIQQNLIDEEIFLEPRLNIEMLAIKCNTNKTYIYQCMKHYTSDNFNTFINKYRVQKAKTLIMEKTEYDLKSIGKMSGFNSPSTFFRAFKEITGLSPATFKNLSQKENMN